jgi:hypothetical protein
MPIESTICVAEVEAEMVTEPDDAEIELVPLSKYRWFGLKALSGAAGAVGGAEVSGAWEAPEAAITELLEASATPFRNPKPPEKTNMNANKPNDIFLNNCLTMTDPPF